MTHADIVGLHQLDSSGLLCYISNTFFYNTVLFSDIEKYRKSMVDAVIYNVRNLIDNDVFIFSGCSFDAVTWSLN